MRIRASCRLFGRHACAPCFSVVRLASLGRVCSSGRRPAVGLRAASAAADHHAHVRNRLALSLLIAMLGLGTAPPAADAHRTSWTWSYGMLVDRIAGARMMHAGRSFRVSPDLVICSGEGIGVRRRGVRRWRHFTCTQTLFRGRVGQDMTFRVHVLGRTRFTVTDARHGPE
jgi:hypothetical protein